MAATSGGSLTIVRKLLSHGANVGDVVLHPLDNAVRLEHAAMVKLIELHDRSDSERRHVLEEATGHGLESVLSVLQKLNINAFKVQQRC